MGNFGGGERLYPQLVTTTSPKRAAPIPLHTTTHTLSQRMLAHTHYTTHYTLPTTHSNHLNTTHTHTHTHTHALSLSLSLSLSNTLTHTYSHTTKRIVVAHTAM